MAVKNMIGPTPPVYTRLLCQIPKTEKYFPKRKFLGYNLFVEIVGTNIPIVYFREHASDQRIKASFRAWEEITRAAVWDLPQDVKTSHPKASILKDSRVVFNIKGNDYRLICHVNYHVKFVTVRWFGSHAEYDEIDADTI